jgi:Flp pilus assembly pilin Flp
MLSTLTLPKPDLRPNDLLRNIKAELRAFNKDERGMNTVEAIILLFVAAVVLLVFFLLIWPLIKTSVMNKLEELFGQDGGPTG